MYGLSVISFSSGYTSKIILSEILMIIGIILFMTEIFSIVRIKVAEEKIIWKQYAIHITAGISGLVMLIGSFFV